MMNQTYQVQITKSARRDLKKIDQSQRRRILTAVVLLQDDPFSGKPLQGKWRGYRSLRIWPYRVLYMVKGRQLLVVVVRVGHRKGIY